MKHKSLKSLIVTTCALAPLAAQAGYYYEAATTAQGAGRDGVSTVRGWIDGSNAKIEFQTRDATGLFEAGSYLLSNDGGKTLYLVNPEKKTISPLDVDQMLQMLGAVANMTAGLVKVEFGDFTSEKLGEGPGEPILGYPTTRHHHKTGYTMRIAVLGMGQRNRNDVENEFWCTDAIPPEGFGVWLRPDRFRTGNEGFDRVIAQEYAVPNCVPLRSRTVTKVTGQRGRESTTTMTTEVTTLREETPPGATFDLPTGYETVPFMGGIAAMTEAAPEATGSSEPAEEPRRPRLRDILGGGR